MAEELVEDPLPSPWRRIRAVVERLERLVGVEAEEEDRGT